jgi:plasmid stability protein
MYWIMVRQGHEDPMHNLHLPLPDDLHGALRRAAAQTDRPATEIAREALRNWLAVWERQRMDDEVTAYAVAVAGTEWDLDPALEAASIAHLLAADGAGR